MSSSKSTPVGTPTVEKLANRELVAELFLAGYKREDVCKEILRRMATPASAPPPVSGIYQLEWIDAYTVELTAMAISEEARYVK